MAEFHLPYHFIPVTGKINGKSSTQYTWSDLVDGKAGPIRHDYWSAQALHGRVLCKLTLQTPTVVGGLQTGPEEAKVVQPYTVDGTPAIPGSSLRGMIGSVLETLSQSAMRVLDDADLSMRKPVGAAVTAFGMYKKSGDKEYLVPLTLHVLKERQKQFYVDQPWCEAFGKQKTWREVLPVLLRGYEAQKDTVRVKQGSFLDSHKPESFQVKKAEFYYAKLAAPELRIDNPLDGDEDILEIRGKYLIGQKMVPGFRAPIGEQEWSGLGEEEKKTYTRGVLFVLGIDGRENTMPGTKKYEYFLPLPNAPTQLTILAEAKERFSRLCELAAQPADEKRHQPALPFLPKGYTKTLPQSGQLMRFDLDAKGRVSEISWSAIWRRLVDGTVHDFFPAEMLPWGADAPTQRDRLTPAEAMLGAVGEGKHRNTQGECEVSSRNLASRLQFSDANTQGQPLLLPQTTLKILGSPKLPCPTLYFNPRQANNSQPFSKDSYRPRGRKYYLHHPLAQVKKQGWNSDNEDNPKQKLRVTPFAQGQSFWFHIDFKNLSPAELTLLLTSLQPAPNYWHRLGLGKPLGLGSVAIETEGVCFIDRVKRYRETDLLASRYTSAYRLASDVAVPAVPDKRYASEAQELATATQTWEPDHSLIDNRTLELLCTIGDVNNVQPGAEVRYPYVEGQENDESEGFLWFEAHKRASTAKTGNGPRPQPLADIQAGTPLPCLQTLTTKKGKHTSDRGHNGSKTARGNRNNRDNFKGKGKRR